MALRSFASSPYCKAALHGGAGSLLLLKQYEKSPSKQACLDEDLNTLLLEQMNLSPNQESVLLSAYQT